MDTRNRAAALGSGEETRGAETVRSLRKDALGRLSNYNGSCASQQVPTRLLLLASGLHGPVECAGLLRLNRGHGITSSLPDVMSELTKELHYVAGDCTLGDGRHLLALQIAPVSTRVHIKWPTETSVEDLLCYLHFGDLNLTETRGEDVNEVYAIESTPPICFLIHTPRTQEQRTVWLLLNNNTRIFQRDTSGTMHMDAFQNMCTQIIPCDSISLQKYQATNKESGHWVLKDELDDFNTSYVWFLNKWQMDISRGIDMIEDMNTAEMLRRDVDVNEIDAIESSLICLFLIGTSSTQGPRTMWLLLKNSAREAFQNTFFHLKSACITLWDCSSLENNQAIMKKNQRISGVWLVKDEWGRSYKPCFHNQKGNKFKLSNVDYKHDGVSIDNNGLLIPIFVRHISGELVLKVNLNQSSQYLMNLYAEKTNTKLECQYFVYGRKRLEPDSTLLFYGVERDTTVHVCTRVLGGRVVTIGQYLLINKEKLLIEVTLPDKRVSLMMTKEGCLFLSTWLKCFTRAFADSKSWNGGFSLEDFRVINHHVLVIKRAERRLDKNSMHADLSKLIGYIKNTFYRKESHLVSQYAPYLKNLTSFLETLKASFLHDVDRLFIETHMVCTESAARGILLVKLRRKNKTLNDNLQRLLNTETTRVDNEINFVGAHSLSETMGFKDIIAYARKKNEEYSDSKFSAFRLMRDGYMHGPSTRFDKSSKPWKEKFKNDDGIELMIPAQNPDLVPDIIYSWIKSKLIDIEPELRAAQVRCTCSICYPSHPDPKDAGESSTARKGKQGAGESSTTGKGKQPASPAQAAASPGFPQPAMNMDRSFLDTLKAAPTRQPSQAAASSGYPQPAMNMNRSFLDTLKAAPTRQPSQAAASSGFPQPAMNMNRSFLDTLKAAPTRQPPQAAASPGFSQPAAPRSWRPPSPAPTQQSSSSGFGGQTPNRGRGKGKR